MADGLHIPTQNRIRKPLAIALSGVGRGWRGREDGSNVKTVTMNLPCIMNTS
jgi:hypothetical protein